MALHLFTVAALCASIVAPALTLLHELGHAIVPLVAGKEPVAIQLGKRRVRYQVRVGRLEFDVDPLPFSYGWCTWQTELRRPALALAYALGPAFSLCALVALSLAAKSTVGFPHHLLVASCCLAAMQFAATACPVRYPAWFGPYAGSKSDGLHILRVLRGEHGQAL